MVPRETLSVEHFFAVEEVWFSALFEGLAHPWEVLLPGKKEAWIENEMQPNLKGVPREGATVLRTTEIKTRDGGKAQIEAGAYLVGDDIELSTNVVIEPGAYIKGPTLLGEGTVVRQGAYIRGGVITGTGAVVGHTTEVKSSIFLNQAKAAHFAYVGDSILGNRVNLGAGTKVSNLKITNDEVILHSPTGPISTGCRKFGAIIGDGTETGCNSVLNPGVLLAPRSLVYPAIAVRKKYYPPKSVIR